MIRLLLDEGVPRELARLLQGAGVSAEPFPNTWKQLSNGDLLDQAIRAGFRILVTCDKRMPYQQSLKDRDIAVLVLPTNRLPDLRPLVPRISEALSKLAPGSFTVLDANGVPTGSESAHRRGK